MLRKAIHQYKELFLIKENRTSLIFSFLFFAGALIIQKIADSYVVSITGTPVSDLISDRLPVVDLDSFMIISALLLTAITLFLVFTKPKFVSFGLKTLSLFIIIRAFLISVTHLGAHPNQLVFNPNSFGYGIYNTLFNTTNDFFFSAHTGGPFLGALILWPEKRWRYLYFIASAVFGASVLFAHIHYSIDVFAAPFIAHSIFEISKNLFRSDYRLSRER